MGWNWTPNTHGKGQTTAKPEAAKGSGTGQAAKGGYAKHDKAHASGVRTHAHVWMCAVCMHDGNAWGKSYCVRCKSGWQDSFPKANGGNGCSKANWAKHAGLATSRGKGQGGKWTHVPSKHLPRATSQVAAGTKPTGPRWFKPDPSDESDDEGNDPKATRSTGDEAEDRKDELNASILEAEGEVAAFRRILKAMEREITDTDAMGVFSSSLQQKEEQLKVLRGERTSALPVPELRRRAEKDRDAVAAKVQRTEQQLEENQQQQQKLEDKADELREQHAAQLDKLERLKQQVAGFAQDEAGNLPSQSVDSAADKQRQTKEAQEAVKGANDAKADANASKAQFDKQTELFQLKNAELDRALAEGIKLIELAAAGNITAAREAAEKAKALVHEANAKRTAEQGSDENPDLMEVEPDSNKKAKTSAA